MARFHVTADGGTFAPPDLTEVRDALDLLVAPGSTHELRGLPSGRSRPIHGDRLDDAVQGALELADEAGLYYTLNPVRTDLVGAAKDRDVLARRWFLIDVDRVKGETDKDSSATDAEKEAARAVSSAVLDDLTARGWPAPLVVDSGNGWHLLYRIDLPNDALARQWVKAALAALGSGHDTAAATIDRTVHNAARIAKLPGTWARKGADSPDRPHRMARLLSVPASIQVVTPELLQALGGSGAGGKAPIAPPPANSSWIVTANTSDGLGAYVRAAVDRELARVALAPGGTRNNILNDAAFRLGTLLHAGTVSRPDLEAWLTFAAGRAGLEATETRATIASGLDAGAANPRELPKPKAAPTVNGAGKHHANGNGKTRGAALEDDGLPPDADVITICLDDVTATPIKWLWPQRIAIGKLTLLAGPAKQGKSFLTMDLAARVSAGLEIPCGGGECFSRASVVLLSAEDDLDDTIRPRLDAAGADVAKIHALTTVRLEDGTLGPFSLSYLPHLERAVLRQNDTRLVIIDPVTHYIGSRIDDHKVAQLRALLGPLRDLASRLRIAVLVISHFNKGGGGSVSAINRVIGSSAYTALARSNWTVIRDPKEPRRRLMLDAGNNLVEDPSGLAYRIVDGRIEWESEPILMDADAALRQEADEAREERRGQPTPKTVGARDWLANLFAAQSEVPSNTVLDQGRANGFSRDALFAAKKDLGIRARKSAEHAGAWVWFLVTDTPTDKTVRRFDGCDTSDHPPDTPF